jgi:hypothetical protein
MTIREALAKTGAYLRSNKTLTRMLVAFVVGAIVVVGLYQCGPSS